MTVLPGAAVHLVPDAFLSPHVVQFQSGRQANRHRLQRVNFELVLRRPIETARLTKLCAVPQITSFAVCSSATHTALVDAA
jgi:hypothetical protein